MVDRNSTSCGMIMVILLLLLGYCGYCHMVYQLVAIKGPPALVSASDGVKLSSFVVRKLFSINSLNAQEGSIITLNQAWCPAENCILCSYLSCTLRKLALNPALEFNLKIMYENTEVAGPRMWFWLPCVHLIVEMLPSL